MYAVYETIHARVKLVGSIEKSRVVHLFYRSRYEICGVSPAAEVLLARGSNILTIRLSPRTQMRGEGAR